MLLKVYCQKIENTDSHRNAGNLIIYHGSADNFENKIGSLYENLSENEKSRADRFRHEIDYKCYVSVHALLRIELSKLLGIQARKIVISVSEYGKPFVRGIDLPFSISRTRNQFAFAFSNNRQYLGIDIEQIKPEIDFTSISSNYFNVKEQRLILSGAEPNEQKRTFYELWTRKEALLKAIGIGIGIGLSRVPVLEGVNVPDLKGVLLNCRMFKIATAMKRDTLISIASSVDFCPEFKSLSYEPN